MIDLPVCIFCGSPTNSWWLFDGRTNTCRCWECYEKGLFETEAEKAFFASFPPAPVKADLPPFPSVKPDLTIWREYFTNGGKERLQNWVEQKRKSNR